MDRRTFLYSAIGTTAAISASQSTFGAGIRSAKNSDLNLKPVSATSDWAEIMRHFLLDRSYIHLAGLLLASHPKCVRDAIQKYRTAFDENPVFAHDRMNNEANVLKQAEFYLQSAPDSVALTDSTTMGLGLMFGGVKLDRGDHVLISTHDHYSTREALRLSTKRQGAKLETIELYNEGSAVEVSKVIATILSHITDETRLVGLTWVHSGTGVKMPVRQVADAIKVLNQNRKKQILLFVDGVHAFGIEDFSVNDLGCDVFVAGCHKWLFGPRGTGLVWANERGWDAVQPILPSFDWPIFQGWMKGEARGNERKAAQMTPGGFHSFEHRWALDEAFKFHIAIGKKKIETRIHSLNSMLKKALQEVPGIKLHTPLSPELSAGIVTFELKNKTPKQIVDALAAQHIIASTTPYSTSYARFTPGILNNEQDLSIAVEAIRKL